MSEARTERTITVKTELPDAAPAAFGQVKLWWGLALAVAIGDLMWIGYPAAIDVRSPDFFPLPLLFVVVFGIVGTIYLVAAIRHALRFRKFGTSALEVQEPRLGGTLRGVVRTARDLAPAGPFVVRLRCEETTARPTRVGQRSRFTECLWESVQMVQAPARSSAGIPFEIAIPANGLASGARSDDPKIHKTVTWTLDVRAALPGLDYYAAFDVKVGGRRRDEAGAKDPATKGTRSAPFAGYAAPPSRLWLLISLVPMVFGSLLLIGCANALWDQIHFNGSGVRATGHVTEHAGPRVYVSIDGTGPPPARGQILVTDFHRWEPGQAVQVTCADVDESPRKCRMDSGLDRWIGIGEALAMSAAFFGAALWAWRRRRGPAPVPGATAGFARSA